MSSLADLFEAARGARDASYSPYSNFAVGAAVETADGRRFTGANIENASYGLSMCAERVAIFAAVHAGAGAIAAVAVTGPDGVATTPCGACRQVLAEFAGPGVPILFALAEGTRETTIGALLPDAFNSKALDTARGST